MLIQPTRSQRCTQLAYSSLVLFASYFSYDIPAALNRSIHTGTSKFTSFEITILYSVYALPNIFVPLLFTRVRMCTERHLSILLSVLVLAGQLVFTLGTFLRRFYILVLGRLLFGIGNETLFVLQSKMLSACFRGRELALALAIFTSVGRLGIILNFAVTPVLARAYGPTLPSLVGLLLLLAGVLANMLARQKVLYYHTDLTDSALIASDSTCMADDTSDMMAVDMPDPRRALPPLAVSDDNVWRRECIMRSRPMSKAYPAILTEEMDMDSLFRKKSAVHIDHSATAYAEQPFTDHSDVLASQMHAYNDVLASQPHGHGSTSISQPHIDHSDVQVSQMHAHNDVQVSQMHAHNDVLASQPYGNSTSFYMLIAVAFLLSSVWSPFYNLAPLLFQQSYRHTRESSSHLMALLETMQTINTIIVGLISDVTGIRLLFVAAGTLVLILSHVLIYRHSNLLLILAMLGVAGPLHSCYWPCIVHAVPHEHLSVALATVASCLNLSFTVSPLIASYLLQIHGTFAYVEMFSVSLGMLALAITALLGIMDVMKGRKT